MILKPVRYLLILPGAALLVSACGNLQAYSGTRLARDERAVVHADPVVSAGLPVAVILRKVDDYPVPVNHRAVELTPGRHHFIVDCRVLETGSVVRFAIDEELQAGGEYRLVADANSRNCLGVTLH